MGLLTTLLLRAVPAVSLSVLWVWQIATADLLSAVNVVTVAACAATVTVCLDCAVRPPRGVVRVPVTAVLQ